MSRYESRHGRQPFPWLLILGYPFLWLYGALSERRRPEQPTVFGRPTDGSFTVTCNGETSDQIPWDASAFEVGYVLDRPDRKVYGTTGAETELEFYTDPKPWEYFPELRYTSPRMVGCVMGGTVYTEYVKQPIEMPYTLEQIVRMLERERLDRYQSNEWVMILNGPHADHPCIVRSEN